MEKSNEVLGFSNVAQMLNYEVQNINGKTDITVLAYFLMLPHIVQREFSVSLSYFNW